MFAFLGTAYASSIRLSAIQGFSPLKTSVAFVLLQGFTLVPATADLLRDAPHQPALAVRPLAGSR